MIIIRNSRPIIHLVYTHIYTRIQHEDDNVRGKKYIEKKKTDGNLLTPDNDFDLLENPCGIFIQPVRARCQT